MKLSVVPRELGDELVGSRETAFRVLYQAERKHPKISKFSY
jgi:hypothetical protein